MHSVDNLSVVRLIYQANAYSYCRSNDSGVLPDVARRCSCGMRPLWPRTPGREAVHLLPGDGSNARVVSGAVRRLSATATVQRISPARHTGSATVTWPGGRSRRGSLLLLLRVGFADGHPMR